MHKFNTSIPIHNHVKLKGNKKDKTVKIHVGGSSHKSKLKNTLSKKFKKDEEKAKNKMRLKMHKEEKNQLKHNLKEVERMNESLQKQIKKLVNISENNNNQNKTTENPEHKTPPNNDNKNIDTNHFGKSENKKILPEINEIKTLLKKAVIKGNENKLNLLPTYNDRIPIQTYSHKPYPTVSTSDPLDYVNTDQIMGHFRRNFPNTPIDSTQLMGFGGRVLDTFGDALAMSNSGNTMLGLASKVGGSILNYFQGQTNIDRNNIIKDKAQANNLQQYAHQKEKDRKYKYKEQRLIEKKKDLQNDLNRQEVRRIDLARQSQQYNYIWNRWREMNRLNETRANQWKMESEANFNKSILVGKWQQSKMEFDQKQQEKEVSSDKIAEHERSEYLKMKNQQSQQIARGRTYLEYHQNDINDIKILEPQRTTLNLTKKILENQVKKSAKKHCTLNTWNKNQIKPEKLFSSGYDVNQLLIDLTGSGFGPYEEMKMRTGGCSSIFRDPEKIALKIEREKQNEDWWKTGIRTFVDITKAGVNVLDHLTGIPCVMKGLKELSGTMNLGKKTIKKIASIWEDIKTHGGDYMNFLGSALTLAHGVNRDYEDLQHDPDTYYAITKQNYENRLNQNIGKWKPYENKLRELSLLETNEDVIKELRKMNKSMRKNIYNKKFDVRPEWLENEKKADPKKSDEDIRNEKQGAAIVKWNEMMDNLNTTLYTDLGNFLGLILKDYKETDENKLKSFHEIYDDYKNKYDNHKASIDETRLVISKFKRLGYNSEKLEILLKFVEEIQVLANEDFMNKHKILKPNYTDPLSVNPDDTIDQYMEEIQNRIEGNKLYKYTTIKNQFNVFYDLYEKFHEVDPWIPKLSGSKKILNKLIDINKTMNQNDSKDNPNNVEVDYRMQKKFLTPRQKKILKDISIEPNEDKRAMKILFNLMQGELTDPDSVFDKKNLNNNHWQRVLYDFYIYENKLKNKENPSEDEKKRWEQATIKLNEAGMLSTETYEEEEDIENETGWFKDTHTSLIAKNYPKKKIINKTRKLSPLTEIPDRFEQIRQYTIIHSNDFPGQNLNEIAQTLIQDHLFDPKDKWDDVIVKPLQNSLKILNIHSLKQCAVEMNNAVRSINELKKFKEMGPNEWNDFLNTYAHTKEGSEKRLEKFYLNIYDAEDKGSLLNGSGFESTLNNPNYVLADRDCNYWKTLINLVLHKIGFPCVKDLYKVLTCQRIYDIVFQDGKCIFQPEFHLCKNPIERSEKFKQSTELFKLFIATYINEMTTKRYLITNSVFQGETGTDNLNPLIASIAKEKEQRRELIYNNWLNGGKKDKNQQIAKSTRADYIPRFEFKDEKPEQWVIGDNDFKDMNKKISFLKVNFKKLVDAKKIDLNLVLKDIQETRIEKLERIDITAETDNFNKLNEDQKIEVLAKTIINKKIPQIYEYNIDLRNISCRGVDEPLKHKRISIEEWKKLPMEQKIAYQREHKNFYKDQDTYLSEWTLDDEQMALDIYLLNKEEKRNGDNRNFYDKDYYLKSTSGCKRFLRKCGLISDKYVYDQYLPKSETIHNELMKDRYKPLIDKNKSDMSLSLDNFEKKYPGFKNWVKDFGSMPEPLLRHKYIDQDQNPDKNTINIPNSKTIKEYINKIDLLKQKIDVKCPSYDEFMSNHPKINSSLIVPGNHRLQWQMFGEAKKPVEYNDTSHDRAYDYAIKKYVNFLLKTYPESKSIFNNIRNICCLTFNDLNRIEKLLSSNTKPDIQLLNTTGEKYNNKINERMTNEYGYAVAILKDLKAKYPNQLDEQTITFINDLSPTKLSRVVSCNLNFIIQNRDNLLNLTNILKKEIDTTDISSFEAYGPHIDLFSLYNKPVGYQKKIEYDEIEEKEEDPLYEKPNLEEKNLGIIHSFLKKTGDWIAPLKPEDKHKLELEEQNRLAKKTHRVGTDLITIIKNDEKELVFKSENKNQVYTILKTNKPKLKRAIKINNELIPQGKSEVNEYQEGGIYSDITTTKYLLNEQEITVEKKVEKPVEMKNQNKSMELYKPLSTPINVMPEDAWEHSRTQMKQNGYNQACNLIQPNLTMHEIVATPM
ncbi:MAG: hypothetical protein LBR15_04740 [Methanobrevibacter sp.]|jgi:hypothetical protein|nr:hypothetical protein [Candidatus Methanovirga australis]